jgi:hypothetical protein
LDGSAAVTAMGSATVRTLSGQEITLQSKDEQKFYRQAQSKYLAENKFTVASDLRALDRLIFYEVMIHRWPAQLASGTTATSAILTVQEEDALRRNLKETAPLVSAIQNDLGLTKAARDKDEESVGGYLVKLKQAAREHGINREKQLGKALELLNELMSLTGAFTRADAHERKKLGFDSADDIVTWVEEYLRPEFTAVDDYFRANSQRFWVRTL